MCKSNILDVGSSYCYSVGVTLFRGISLGVLDMQYHLIVICSVFGL